MLFLPFLTTSNTWLRAHPITKKILIYDGDFVKGYNNINIFLVFSGALYKPSAGNVKIAENDIFLLVSSCLMSIFSPNVGHQKKIISKS